MFVGQFEDWARFGEKAVNGKQPKPLLHWWRRWTRWPARFAISPNSPTARLNGTLKRDPVVMWIHDCDGSRPYPK